MRNQQLQHHLLRSLAQSVNADRVPSGQNLAGTLRVTMQQDKYQPYPEKHIEDLEMYLIAGAQLPVLLFLSIVTKGLTVHCLHKST